MSALGVVGVLAIYAWRSDLLPTAKDVFFLDTPARSIAILVLITFGLRFAHEGCHWLTARAEGISATVTVTRRLYMLTFETDLTRLWGLPRRRRYWPLLAGTAFDVGVLAVILLLRLAAPDAASVTSRLLAALAFLQVTAIATQFFVFLRTDMYAVLVTAAGCFDLSAVTRMLLRRHLGLARPEHSAALVAAHPRDRAVARWYVWVHAAGMVLAGWFFVEYFAPVTVHLVLWIVSAVSAARVGSGAFWEALAFGLVLLSAQLLTVSVAIRDFFRRRQESV